jgi:hypothetical protein
LATIDPIELNILGVQQLIGSKLNKSPSGVTTNEEGVESDKIDALDLPMSDEELVKLARKWEVQYAPYEAKIKTKQQSCRAYYLGMQEAGSPKANTYQTPVADNLIFEAAETFLPATLAKNPEPVVFTDDTTEGQEVADAVKTVLQYHADTLNLRGQCTLIVRKWLVDLLAVMKHGWDDEISDIWDDVRDVKDFIFDTEGYVDMSGDFIGYLGERITVTAERLIELFPKHTAYITIMCEGKMGTRVTYTEWWNDDYTFTTFTTFKTKILDKSKNPNYIYGGLNHFGRPKKPYTFFSVFSFGDQPHDVTGLIEQNIANQKVISRRTTQIDFNLSRQNNSDIFSANNWTQETAKQAATAIKEGHPVIVPAGGPMKESIERLPAQGLDAGFFNDLQARKQGLRMSFGTEGITAQAPEKDELATGLMLNKEHDTSRISGGIGDALERFVKAVFNQHVQFYYVYYDEPHYGMILGQMKAVQYKQLQQSDFEDSDGNPRRLVVSVSPDSMKPHDEITEMNQALTLWEQGALDPKTLLIRVNFPDPDKVAEQVILWKLDPMAYAQKNYPEIAQILQQAQQGKQDPDAMKAQADIEAKKQEMQIDAQKAQQEMSLEQQKAELEMKIKKIEAQQKIALSQQEGQNKLRLQEEAGRQKIEQGAVMGKAKIKQGEEAHKAKVEQTKKSQALKAKQKPNESKKESKK